MLLLPVLTSSPSRPGLSIVSGYRRTFVGTAAAVPAPLGELWALVSESFGRSTTVRHPACALGPRHPAEEAPCSEAPECQQRSAGASAGVCMPVGQNLLRSWLPVLIRMSSACRNGHWLCASSAAGRQGLQCQHNIAHGGRRSEGELPTKVFEQVGYGLPCAARQKTLTPHSAKSAR